MIEKIKFDSVLLFLTLFLVFSMFYCIFLEKGGGGKKNVDFNASNIDTK